VAINGAKVRELRRIAGIRQGDLAERIGISQAMVSQIEHGGRACKPDTIQAIAAELGCTFEDLSGEPGEFVRFVRTCKRLSESQLSVLHKIAVELIKVDSPPKTKELAATDSQQLQAKIRARVDRFAQLGSWRQDSDAIDAFLADLRELSAVQ